MFDDGKTTPLFLKGLYPPSPQSTVSSLFFLCVCNILEICFGDLAEKASRLLQLSHCVCVCVTETLRGRPPVRLLSPSCVCPLTDDTETDTLSSSHTDSFEADPLQMPQDSLDFMLHYLKMMIGNGILLAFRGHKT